MLFYSFFQSYFVSMEKAHIYQKIKGSKDNLIFFFIEKMKFSFLLTISFKILEGREGEGTG